MSLSNRRMTDFNPLSSVDVSAIEAAMKMASLDQLRGYSQDHYSEVNQSGTTEYLSEASASGYQIIREPLWNKGMSRRCHATLSHGAHVRLVLKILIGSSK